MEVANKLLLVSSGLDMLPSAIYFSMWFSSLVPSCYYRCAHILLVSVKYLKSMRMASHICGLPSKLLSHVEASLRTPLCKLKAASPKSHRPLGKVSLSHPPMYSDPTHIPTPTKGSLQLGFPSSCSCIPLVNDGCC